jgi:hypothetical protein
LLPRANPGVDAEDLRASLARMMDPVDCSPPRAARLRAAASGADGAAEIALSSGRAASGTIG